MSVNKHGLDWQTLKKRSLDEIEKHRQELEELLVAPDRAQQLRGMIAALREQIVFVEPLQAPIVKDTNYG